MVLSGLLCRLGYPPPVALVYRELTWTHQRDVPPRHCGGDIKSQPYVVGVVVVVNVVTVVSVSSCVLHSDRNHFDEKTKISKRRG